ncbi:uncharacterized protein LOC124545917 [Schistocerca americana]|uniref:uncharacterized protein LOC124545917 n=1 Tax=Schistocerca americana TaxID=7009 RepID=UPI001F4F4DD2|nr:uncharacterized protein LOC124545917 [Schistocerca americana]
MSAPALAARHSAGTAAAAAAAAAAAGKMTAWPVASTAAACLSLAAGASPLRHSQGTEARAPGCEDGLGRPEERVPPRPRGRHASGTALFLASSVLRYEMIQSPATPLIPYKPDVPFGPVLRSSAWRLSLCYSTRRPASHLPLAGPRPLTLCSGRPARRLSAQRPWEGAASSASSPSASRPAPSTTAVAASKARCVVFTLQTSRGSFHVYGTRIRDSSASSSDMSAVYPAATFKAIHDSVLSPPSIKAAQRRPADTFRQSVGVGGGDGCAAGRHPAPIRGASSALAALRPGRRRALKNNA